MILNVYKVIKLAFFVALKNQMYWNNILVNKIHFYFLFYIQYTYRAQHWTFYNPKKHPSGGWI